MGGVQVAPVGPSGSLGARLDVTTQNDMQFERIRALDPKRQCVELVQMHASRQTMRQADIRIGNQVFAAATVLAHLADAAREVRLLILEAQLQFHRPSRARAQVIRGCHTPNLGAGDRAWELDCVVIGIDFDAFGIPWLAQTLVADQQSFAGIDGGQVTDQHLQLGLRPLGTWDCGRP